ANAANDATYAYDLNGNQVARTQSGVVTGFIYDTRDQLVEVQNDGTLVETYDFSYDGLRTRKSGSGNLFRYVYDGRSLLLETDLGGNTISKYEWGSDRLLSLNHASEGRTFYLFDALGSPVALSKPDGTLQARYLWDAWGNLRSEVGASSSIFGFTGYQRDETTGLYYARNRFYDPELGRFISPDPLEYVDGPNVYAYAKNNPIAFTDPLGLAADPVSGEEEEEKPIGNRLVDWVSETWNESWLGQKVAAGVASVEGFATGNRERVEKAVRDDFGSTPQMDPFLAELATEAEMDPVDLDKGAKLRTELRETTAEISGTITESATREGTYLLVGGLTGRIAETSSQLLRLPRSARAVFEGLEVRGIRDLSHVDESTLRAMSEYGFSATDRHGNKLILHHLDQNPAGPVVEMPAMRHSIGNRVQHPLGNTPGAGLSPSEREAFDQWRVEYWKARAREELGRRGPG
ncbi:MAG: RHS repeat domain-containing protein, partial [Candidatus Binatia bacterium]